MACPFFEPQYVARDPKHVSARVPLIEEYDGVCHASSELRAIPEELRFRCCNHGYSQGCCPSFPRNEARSSVRYHVVRQHAGELDVMLVEEQNFAPLRWRSIKYHSTGELIEPLLDDVCLRAQLIAFCRSYLRRFAD